MNHDILWFFSVIYQSQFIYNNIFLNENEFDIYIFLINSCRLNILAKKTNESTLSFIFIIDDKSKPRLIDYDG